MDVTARARFISIPPMARAVLVAALVIALLGLAIVFAGSRVQRLPAPFGPAANGAILTTANGDIFASAPDGTGRHPLIAGPTNDFAGWHSHDGSKFVFWRESGPSMSVLMIANSDGTGVRQLLATPLQSADWFEWSPRDDRLAIVHGADGRRVLSILDVATGALRDVAVPGLNVDNDVYWLPPDGSELVFTARRELGSSTGAAIYAIRTDGSDTLRTVVPERSEDWSFLGLEPSPDGRTLTYWMYEAVQGSSELHARIHLVDVATNADRVVRLDPSAIEESELRFSPDGKTGVILRADSRANFLVVRLDGTAPNLAIGPGFAGNEEKWTGFSPDGRMWFLAFKLGRPSFFDVATGKETTLEAWGEFSSWQRLAP
jgi:Tol biopolymer transport system component